MKMINTIETVAVIVFAFALSACNGNSGKSGSEVSGSSEMTEAQVQNTDSVAGNSVEKPTVIDFYADWCGPCRHIAPLFDQLAEKYGDRIEFKRVNVDESEQLAAQYDITSIPTFVFLDSDGKVIDKVVGADSESLTSAVKKLYDSNNL